MISMKAAILAGTLVVGAVGITAYASGTFCTEEATAQTAITQTILTSGGDNACCADETGAKKTVAQNAVFKPTMQTAALSGGTCTATTKQKAEAAPAASCDAKETVKTASLTSAEGSCCADETGAKKTVAQNAVFKPTNQTATLAGGTCTATAKQTAEAAPASCGAKETVKTASLTSAEKSCCAMDGTKKTSSKTTLAGVVPTATATN